jgi:hypothetical protein
MRALEKDRLARWPSADKFAKALAVTPEGRAAALPRATTKSMGLSDPLSSTDSVRALSGELARQRRRWPWLVAGLAPVLVVGGLWIAHALGYIDLPLPAWFARAIGWK